MPRINSDTVIALLLLVACGILFHDTFYFREVPLTVFASEVWPRIVLIFLFVFSAIYLFQSLRAGTVRKNGERQGAKAWFWANRNVFWCYGLFAAFLITLPFLGMLLGSALFVFAALTAMGPNERRSHVVNAMVAVVSVGTMWALFTFGLKVMLPQGAILRIF